MILRIISVLVTLGLAGSKALALSLVFLVCRLVALPSCGSLVGPLPPLFLFLLWLLLFPCRWPPPASASPLRLIVVLSPAGVSPRVSGCTSRRPGCLTCWCCSLSAFSMGLLEPLPAGRKFGYDLLPLLIAPHGNKGLGPVWGFALSTMLRVLFRCLASPF